MRRSTRILKVSRHVLGYAKPQLTCSDLVATTLLSLRTKNERISVPEQPELTLGAHVWDCALPLAYHLHVDFTSFLPKGSPKDRPLQIVELGAGCGLDGIIAALSAQKCRDHVQTLLTDIDQVVSSVTTSVLERTSEEVPNISSVSATTLDWTAPKLSAAAKEPTDLLVLATDVLYNVESHQPFLDCLIQLFRQSSHANSVAWLAYKPRTHGDDAFFDMGRRAGLFVERQPQYEGLIQDVQLYRINEQSPVP